MRRTGKPLLCRMDADFCLLKQFSQFRFIFQICLKERERVKYQIGICKVSSVAALRGINKWTAFPSLPLLDKGLSLKE